MGGVMISIQNEFKVPGTDVVVEKGDRIKVKEARDYRNLFLKFAGEKNSFEETLRYRSSHIPTAPAYVAALKDLVAQGRYKQLSPSVKALDNFFTEDESNFVEWVVFQPRFGYFYVNNEGYRYARYLAYIPDIVATQIV